MALEIFRTVVKFVRSLLLLFCSERSVVISLFDGVIDIRVRCRISGVGLSQGLRTRKVLGFIATWGYGRMDVVSAQLCSVVIAGDYMQVIPRVFVVCQSGKYV